MGNNDDFALPELGSHAFGKLRDGLHRDGG
jgi:hypothetical protein